MTNDANFAYRETETLTADPVGLVVILYEMLLKDLREAVSALATANIERRATAVRHCLLVLQQLQGTLDMDRGGVVAENLDRFYNFIRSKLLEGQIKASPEIFEQQITFVASIRDAWQQVRAEQLSASLSSAAEEAPVMPGAILGGDAAATADWSA
jgi:flagellar protein FliS